MADIAVINYVAPPAITTLRTHTARVLCKVDLLSATGVVLAQDDYLIDLGESGIPAQLRSALEDVVTRLARRAGRIA